MSGWSKNHTLKGGTSPYSLCMGVPPLRADIGDRSLFIAWGGGVGGFGGDHLIFRRAEGGISRN